MELGEFVAALAEGGQVRVVADAAGPPAGAIDQVLRERDAVLRLDAAGTPPPLDLIAGRWSARLLYRACACFAFRDIAAETIAKDLAEPCPSARDLAATHWSVDLVFEHLHDLFGLARAIAAEDPLLVALRRLAADWPLAAVGIPGVPLGDPTRLLADDCLRVRLLDRIVARQDAERLADPAIAAALRRAMGQRPDLAGPRVAAVLAAFDSPIASAP